MNINIIKLYINNISKEQVKSYLEKENIIVNNLELEFLYNTMKHKYKEIINNDVTIFQEIKNNINEDAYNKLLLQYNRYSSYLSK